MNARSVLLGLMLWLWLAGCGTANPPTDVPKVDTGIDPEAWVRIPKGEFLFGLHNEEVDVHYDFEIMKTPVTNAQWAAFLNQGLARGELKMSEEGVLVFYPGEPFEGGKHEEEIGPGDYLVYPLDRPGLKVHYQDGEFVVQEGFENHPATYVTWFGGWAYCQAVGGRLPQEVEWEKAARGTDGRPYPWGWEITRHHANYYKSRDPFEHYWGGLGETTPVGFYNGKTYLGFATEDAASPYGVYDMAGNVWEWMIDTEEHNPLLHQTHQRILKGGSFADYEIDARAVWRNFAPPEFSGPTVGFRCVRLP